MITYNENDRAVFNVNGFAFTTVDDWLTKLAPLCHPIRSETKTRRGNLALVFPRFASVT